MSYRFANLQLVVAPTVEPVTLAEAKAQLRVDTDDENAYITDLISVAREWAEDFTGRALITQQWAAQYIGWPCDRTFILPRPRVQTVETLVYVGEDGEVTVDEASYIVDPIQNSVLVLRAFGAPGLSVDRVNPIQFNFTAGYGDAGTDVPSRIKQAILLAVNNWFENRTPVDAVKVFSKVPMSAEALLNQFRVRPI